MTRKYNYDGVRELYDQGLNDTEIGKIIGIPPGSIAHWRKKHKYVSNVGLTKETRGKIKKLYSEGMRDCDIARTLGLKNYQVHAWRRANDKDPNNPPRSAISRIRNKTLVIPEVDDTLYGEDTLMCDGPFLEAFLGKKLKKDKRCDEVKSSSP